MPTSRTTARRNGMGARTPSVSRFLQSAAALALVLPICTAAQVGTPAPAAASQNQPATSATPISSIVQPATTELAQTLPLLHPDKWKLSSELRRRADDNLSSVSNDLSSTLPNLVAGADTPQPALPALFALSRNLRALYDVVLRVSTAAEIAAPDQQAAALTQALNSLATARQQLDERLDASAAAQQQQLATLQSSLAASREALAQAKAAAVAQPAPSTTHTRTRTHRKPATPTPPSP